MGEDAVRCCRFRRPRWGAVLAVAIVAASLVTQSVSVQAQDPDLSKIAQALQSWRSSFVNLRVVFEWWGRNWLKDPEAARPLPEDRFFREEWVWADVGAVRTEEWLYEEGRLKAHEVAGANGRTLRSFQAVYGENGDPSDFLSRLRVKRMLTSAPMSVRNVPPLTFLYAPVTCEWLGDRLLRRDPRPGMGMGDARPKLEVTLQGYEDIGGARCARVRIQGVVSNVLWLDPARDFLVRRVRPDPQQPDGGYVFDVEEFQRVGTTWFPKRGTLGRHGDKPGDWVHWLVTEVAFNLPLDAEFFEPPAPQIGTVVSEPNGRVYRFGEKRPREARGAEIADQAKKNVFEAGQPVSAAPPLPRAIWWSRLLLLGSTLLLLFGIAAWALWHRSR